MYHVFGKAGIGITRNPRLMTGPAALLLCGNAAGKAIDAHTIRDNFTLVSAGMDHAVAYRLKDAGVLRTVTAGLAEPRPNVLVSRPTRLMKGFLAGSESRRTSDKNQQQFARILLGCGVAAFLFTLLYRKDAGTAFTALASVLCLGAPLAGTLISAMPMRLMQRSARADRRGHPRLEGYPTAGPCERAAGHGAGSFPQRVHYAARHQARCAKRILSWPSSTPLPCWPM